MSEQEYPRAKRITQRSAIRKVATEGKRVRTADLDVRYIASPLGYLRVGVIVPRYGHSAVERNRLKRRLRELVRRETLDMEGGLDIMIRSRPTAYQRTFAELKEQMIAARQSLARKTETQPG